MRTAEIKRRFLAHFEANGHTVVPSAPLPAIDDPNLLFVNAGMVQFVPVLPGPARPRRTSGRSACRSASARPDIDEVGKTSRHGTFFQMNGNFSFGDYFKEGAIPLAWELATKPVDEGGFGLDPERIWATVYLDDDEAIEIWQRDRRARRSASCAAARRTTSGRWASPGRPARARRSTTTAARSTAPRAARRSTRTATWSSGTSSSCSTRSRT